MSHLPSRSTYFWELNNLVRSTVATHLFSSVKAFMSCLKKGEGGKEDRKRVFSSADFSLQTWWIIKQWNIIKVLKKNIDFIIFCPLKISINKEGKIMRILGQFSCSVMSDSLRPHGLQHPRLPCPLPILGASWNSCPSCQWCHPTISSSVIPSPPAFNPFQHQGLFQRVSSSHQVTKVLEFQLQHQSFEWIFRTDFP